MTSMRSARLPDGTKIWCDEPWGVGTVWNEITAYFLSGESVSAGEVVFDVGANIGLFSLAAFRQSEGRARIWSFEPIPSTCAILEANARRFDPEQSQWHTVRAGLGERNEIAVLHYFPRLSVLSGRHRNAARAKHEFDEVLSQERIGEPLEFINAVPRPLRRSLGRAIGFIVLRTRPVAAQIWTLSDALKKLKVEQVDWLKVDVEGAELDVLRGVDERDWPRIRRVVCELESSEMGEEATILLQNAGFRVEMQQNPIIRGEHLKLLFAWRE